MVTLAWLVLVLATGNSGLVMYVPQKLTLLTQESLIVASMVYNPTPYYSPWIVQTFAGTNLSMPSSYCSLEMLGFQWLGAERWLPIIYTGQASLNISDSPLLQLECVFRGLNEGHRLHYSIATVCPIISNHQCQRLVSISQSNASRQMQFAIVSATIAFYQPHIRLRTAFTSTISTLSDNILASQQSGFLTGLATADYRQVPMAVCTVIPYRSSMTSKRSIHASILRNWVTYYSRLGMHVFIFDKHGTKHADYMDTNPLVHYRNYTVGQYLIPARFSRNADSEGFDNEASDKEHNRNVFNEDKVMTLNHCRAEARAEYGIDHVIVTDTDEFLHCGKSRSLDELRVEVWNLLRRQAAFHEVSYMQNTPPARNVSAGGRGMMECMSRAVAANASIFRCFASAEFSVDSHGHKTVYLGYNCPYTSYHQGCPQSEGATQQQPGLCQQCKSRVVRNDCRFVHASLKSEVFKWTRFVGHYSSSNSTVSRVEASESEINEILNKDFVDE